MHDAAVAQVAVGPLDLTGMNFTLDNTGLTVAASVCVPNLPTLGSQAISITINYDGTLDGVFVNPSLPSAPLSYSLEGFNLTQGSLDFYYDGRDYTLKARGTLDLYAGVNLTLDGYLSSDGSFDLSTRTNATIAGLDLSNVQFELTQTGFSFDGEWTNPLFAAPFTGTIDADGSFDFSTSGVTAYLAGVELQGLAANVDLGFNASTPMITLNADATIPLLGANLPLTGNFLNGQYSFTASPISFSADGFPLSSASVTLSAAGIGFGGEIDNLPLIGRVDVSGQILDANHYGLERRCRPGWPSARSRSTGRSSTGSDSPARS